MDGMKPYRGNRPYIFISYAHRDRERIAPILRQLTALRYRVWYDEGIDPGTEWDNNIATHIEGCTFLFAFISANYLQSDNCKDELNFARDLQKERLLIYLEDVKLPLGMAMRLNRLQAIHQYTYSRQEDFYDKLVSVPDLGVCQDPPPQHAQPSETAPGNLPRIKVIGVGGAGCNIVNRLMDYGPKLVEYIAVNTDKQSLSHSRAPVRILIGEKETKGLGAAGSAETGRLAAEENREELVQLMDGADLVFVTCGLGGGTGSGASPVIAGIARALGILTVGVVSLPFRFEGSGRAKAAAAGLEELKASADTLIVLHNDKLMSVASKGMTMADAFRFSDETLNQGLQGIIDLMTVPGIVRLDFGDLCAAMHRKGMAYLGVGIGEGPDRAADAVRKAIDNPLLETRLNSAGTVLVNVTSTADLTMTEVSTVSDGVTAAAKKSAGIVLGTALDETMGDTVRVVIIATELA